MHIYIYIYFLDGSHSPTEHWFTKFPSGFSFFNKKNHTFWKILYRWSQEETETEDNFNCRREMYPQDEGHLWMTQSLGSKSTEKRSITWLMGLLFLPAERKWLFVQVALEVYITPRPLVSCFLLELSTEMSVGRRELSRTSDQPVPELCLHSMQQAELWRGKVHFSILPIPTSIIDPSIHLHCVL